MYNLEQLYNEGTKWLEDIHFNTFSSKPSRLPYEVWEENKKQFLFSLLRQQLIHSVPVEVAMTEDELRYKVQESGVKPIISQQYKPEFNRIFTTRSSELDENEKIIERCLFDLLDNKTLANQHIENDYAFDWDGKRVKFNKGTKVTKLFRFFVKESELDTLIKKYATIFNQKTIKGDLCLSVHPLDYFSVSDNQCGWNSCFSVHDGSYRISTTGLLTSPNTMIAYLSSGDVEYKAYDKSMTWNNKKWRAYVTMSHDQKTFHIGREYPYSNSILRQKVVEMIAELTGLEYQEVNREIYINTPDAFYNDGFYHLYEATNIEDDERVDELDIAEDCYCMECGTTYDLEGVNGMFCTSCHPEYHEDYVGTCTLCDTHIFEYEDFTYVSSCGEYVCEWCAPKLTYCQECDEVYIGEDEPLVEVYHRKEDRYYIIEMCSHCLKDAMEHDNIVYVVKEGRYRTSDEYQMQHFGDILPVV